MSNETTISNILNEMNTSLANMDAALTIIEYSGRNEQPIPLLAKMTVQESCEEIQQQCELISKMVGE